MWKFIGMFGLKAIPWPVWLGIGSAVLAMVIGYGALMRSMGFTRADQLWERAKLTWERKQATDNNKINRVTMERDADLMTRIEENRRKWSEQSQSQ